MKWNNYWSVSLFLLWQGEKNATWNKGMLLNPLTSTRRLEFSSAD